MSEPLARRRMGGITAELWPGAPYEVEATAATGVLGFAFETQIGEDAIDTSHRRPFCRRAHSLAWVPPGCPVYSCSARGGEYLVLRGVRPEEIGHPQATRRALSNLVAPHALAAAAAVRRFLLAGGPPPDTALQTLCVSLAERFDNETPTLWLTPARLAAIDRYIDRHLAGRITLDDLAGALDLSAGFLVRAFRQGLGTTPHRYLTERRLARARILLERRHPVAEIADACGFADQAHLTRQMRAAFGITPGAWAARKG